MAFSVCTVAHRSDLTCCEAQVATLIGLDLIGLGFLFAGLTKTVSGFGSILVTTRLKSFNLAMKKVAERGFVGVAVADEVVALAATTAW